MNADKNKVLLLYPGSGGEAYDLIPLSLLYIAQPLLDAGMEVEIIDQRMEKDFYDRVRQRLTPDLICVGISCMTGPQISPVINICERVRKAADVPIVLGGPHPSLFPEQTLACPLIDYVVLGRGEEPFLNLVRALKEGGPVEGINHIGFRSSGRTRVNRGTVSRPGHHAIPYHLLSRYPASTTIPIISSWGCPFHCTFCVEKVLHPDFYQLPAGDVLKMIEEALLLQPRFISFFDDNFLLDIRRIVTIFSLCREKGLAFQWICTGRVDMALKLDDQTLRFLKDSGLVAIFCGIESGSPEMLKLINKGITPEMAIRLNLKLKEADIIPQYSFMAGFPGETKADFQQTLDLIQRLKTDNPRAVIWKLNQYTPYPGTAMYELAVQRGYRTPRKLEEWSEAYFYSREFVAPYDVRL
ncbi:MAG: radical SAM protein [Thermodesulfobacteriota bacterium]